MKIIDREMVTKVTLTEKSDTSLYCQASFNSDGNITLRNYNIENKNSDEIIILSAEETHSIIELFRKIKRQINDEWIPF